MSRTGGKCMGPPIRVRRSGYAKVNRQQAIADRPFAGMTQIRFKGFGDSHLSPDRTPLGYASYTGFVFLFQSLPAHRTAARTTTRAGRGGLPVDRRSRQKAEQERRISQDAMTARRAAQWPTVRSGACPASSRVPVRFYGRFPLPGRPAPPVEAEEGDPQARIR